jgi:ferrous iron transport protein A
MPDTPIAAPPAAGSADQPPIRLSHAQAGDAGWIVDVRLEAARDGGVSAAELERRLLEFGFVEGAAVELLHEGPIGGDPIAVRLDDMRVALRRDDANEVWVRLAKGAK